MIGNTELFEPHKILVFEFGQAYKAGQAKAESLVETVGVIRSAEMLDLEHVQNFPGSIPVFADGLAPLVFA